MKRVLFIALFLVGGAGLSAPTWAQCAPAGANGTPASRYEIRGDEVADKLTGLTWQRCGVGQHWADATGCAGAPVKANWSDATRMADGVWRLPSKDELLTLISPTCQGPRADTSVFPVAGGAIYWTSTDMNPAYAWYVSLSDGSAFAFSRDMAFAVRLVRGGNSSVSRTDQRR